MIKILFVVDESSILKQAKNFLERQNERLNIETVYSVEKALEKLDKSDYDVIVSDYQKPKLNGLKLLKKLRKDRNSEIPFIIFTGKVNEEVAIEALNLGADRYLQKDEGPKSQYSVLADAIVQEAEKKGAEHELQERVKELRLLYNLSKVKESRKSLEELLTNAVNLLPDAWQYPEFTCARIRYEDKEYKTSDFRETEWCLSSDIAIDGENRGFVEVCYLEEKPLEDDGPFLKEEIELLKEFAERISSILEELEARKKLKKSHEEYKELINGMNDTAWVIGLNGDLLEVNKAAVETLGYSREELLSMKPHDIDTKLDPEKITELIESMPEDEAQVFETIHRTKDGEEFPVEISSSLINYQGEQAILSISRDISKRKEAEKQLKRTNEKLRTIFEAMEDAVVMTDMEGNILEANQAAAKMAGFEDKEEYMKHNAFEFVHPEDLDIAKKNTKKAFKKGEPANQREYRALTKDGESIYVLVGVDLVRNDSGEPIAIVNVIKDITEQKEIEKRQEFLHSLLRHDVQNKNQIIQGYLELTEEFDLPKEVENHLSKAKKATKEGIDIIKKVRTLKDIDKEKEINEVNLKPLLKEVINESKAHAKEKGIDIKCQNHECRVIGGELLKEMFLNLIENSIQHSKGTKIRITSKEKEDKCIITIEDDGKGIPDKQKTKIFKKGFKDQKTGGSGIGLYLAKKTVESYKGKIEVKDSELGGARFDIHLQKV